MRRVRILLALAATVFAASPDAGAQTDVSVSAELLDGRIVLPGTFARVQLTIANHGPGALTLPAAAGTSWTNFVGRRTIAIGVVPETHPCTLSVLHLTAPPGQPDGFFATVVANEQGLAAGESASCIVGLTTFVDSPAQMRARFGILAPSDDPVPGNNEAFTTVFTGAASYRPIPATGLISLSLLALVSGLTAAIGLRVRYPNADIDRG